MPHTARRNPHAAAQPRWPPPAHGPKHCERPCDRTIARDDPFFLAVGGLPGRLRAALHTCRAFETRREPRPTQQHATFHRFRRGGPRRRRAAGAPRQVWRRPNIANVGQTEISPRRCPRCGVGAGALLTPPARPPTQSRRLGPGADPGELLHPEQRLLRGGRVHASEHIVEHRRRVQAAVLAGCQLHSPGHPVGRHVPAVQQK